MNIFKTCMFVFGLFLLLILNLKCLKEEIPNNTPMSQQSDTTTLYASTGELESRSNAGLIFYITSLTTDNYLLPQSRTYNIYNKFKVREVQFTASGIGLANINGVLCKSYKIRIIFTDNSTESFTAYAKNGLDKFNYTPTGENLLSTTHTANKIKLVATTNKSQAQYNFWRDSSIEWTVWQIYKNNTFVEQRYLEATDKNANIFIPKHQH